ncbi:hypothetical protein C4D60_Mb01t03900 [Musa balbisiana]|uniref:Uncharacterized protein n=1 Tax=Musa balbisiana TaxID=52838 RepID=A0A4S8JJX1_MUSBA|nr:hypothetical protein C4D60_Mb01t03900 [Musa balbisiana]
MEPLTSSCLPSRLADRRLREFFREGAQGMRYLFLLWFLDPMPSVELDSILSSWFSVIILCFVFLMLPRFLHQITAFSLAAAQGSLSMTSLSIVAVRTPIITDDRYLGKTGTCLRTQLAKPNLSLPCIKCQPFQCRQSKLEAGRLLSRSLICAASWNARCAAEQTQTVTRQSSTITIAPIQGKEKSPELDDGGTGFPPRDDDGGGGGGGGGWHHWSGGFFFFGLLAFLGLLKDQESEGPYRDRRRR